MSFYDRQAAARRLSRWLVLAFAVAIALVVAVLSVLVLALFALEDELRTPMDAEWRSGLGGLIGANPELALAVALFWLAILMGASTYKALSLRTGGAAVTRALGASRIERSTSDLALQRLRNVVEEMAIASSVPVPEIYVLEREPGINAFAAGHSPANAAIAVTRGTLDRLSREELQGVIAHEFSHILNGDMRLNIRMVGWLFGLMIVAILGRTLLRLPAGSNRGAAALRAGGAAMFVLGYLGLGLGRLIQAAVSRQRERLADASAVQFTRNPDGLKGAFLKIAATAGQGRLLSTQGDEIAHMLLVQGAAGLLATHPPLAMRIRELDPQFEAAQLARVAAEYLRAWERSRAAGGASQSTKASALDAAAARGPGTSGAQRLQELLVPAVATEIADRVGSPQPLQIAIAHELRLAMPVELARVLDSPPEAHALMLAVLLARDPARRSAQLELLRAAQAAPDAAGTSASSPLQSTALLERLASALPVADALDPWLRLPAVLELFATLRRLPQSQRVALAGAVSRLARLDGEVELFEFCLSRLVYNALIDELEARVEHGSAALGTCFHALGTLFGVLAREGAHRSLEVAQRAYEQGIRRVLPLRQPKFEVPPDWPRRLWTALSRLEALDPIAKRKLVEALVVTAAHDERLTLEEAELLRTVCAVLRCPLPPLLPQLLSSAQHGA